MKSKHNYLALMASLTALLVALTACGGQPAQADAGETAGPETAQESVLPTAVGTEAPETETPQQEPENLGLEFPYELDGGKLVLTSLFQSSIGNPDCGDEMGENIASLELVNQSGEFLDSASITVTLDDGTALSFEIDDIPADGTVWAFETSNGALSDNPICLSIDCETAYEAETPLMADQISIQAAETSVTIQNLTGQELSGLNVSFHCLFDDNVYFGGKVYTYPVDTIPAGGSAGIDVVECYLGTAEAVRAAQG